MDGGEEEKMEARGEKSEREDGRGTQPWSRARWGYWRAKVAGGGCRWLQLQDRARRCEFVWPSANSALDGPSCPQSRQHLFVQHSRCHSSPLLARRLLAANATAQHTSASAARDMRISAAVDQTSRPAAPLKSNRCNPERTGSAARKTEGPRRSGTATLPLAAGAWREGSATLIQAPSPADSQRTPEEDAVVGPCEALL